MKNQIVWILVASLGSQLMLPMAAGLALDRQDSTTILLADKGNRGGGGGNRGNRSGGGGNRAERPNKHLNSTSVGGQGSGRVQRDKASRPSRTAESRSVNRDNVNRGGARQTSNRIERPQAQTRNVDRNQTRDRLNNDRDVNVNRDRAVDINRDRTVNVDRNVVVNPRGGAAWGWNRGVAWVPRTNYWGGGFWGPFAVGAATVGMTSAIINASSSNYYVVEQSSPGYDLLSSYGLAQTQCLDDPNLVYMYGPQDSLICANPSDLVPPGDYDINIDTLTLVAR